MADAKLNLSGVKLPPWLVHAAETLIDTAESSFCGEKRGADKKAWVRQTLIELAKKADVKAIPNWIEDPVKELVIDLLIEVLWSRAGAATLRARRF
jgi:hypothetical protein